MINRRFFYGILMVTLVTLSSVNSYSQELEDDELCLTGGKIQEHPQKKFTFGPKLGLNVGKFLTSRRLTDPSSHLGLTIGGFARYRLLDWLSVQGELHYNQLASTNLPISKVVNRLISQTTPAINSSSSDIMCHVIDIPLTVNFSLIELGGNIRPRFFVGPNFSLIMASYADTYVNRQVTSELAVTTNSMFNVSDEFEPFEMGAVAGLGLDFQSKKFLYTVDFRYRAGFSDIFRGAVSDFVNDKYTTSSWSIIFGLGF